MLLAALACSLLLAPPRLPSSLQETPGVLVEGFEGRELSEGWRVFKGLSHGDGPPSTVAVHDGALHLAGDEHTGRWMVLSRTVPVGELRWLRLAVRMRSREVTVGDSKFLNAGAWLRFDDGEVTNLPPLLGTQEWTWVARRYTVPRYARTVTVGLYLSLQGELEVDELRLERVPDWRELRDGSFLFRWLPGDEPSADERKQVREAFERACEFLDVHPEYSIVYLKYPDVAIKEEYMGSRRPANLEGTIVHTTLRVDRHEMVHLLAKPWGTPVPLLSEGLAAWLDGEVAGEPWKQRARALTREGWIPLDRLMERQAFLDTPEEVAHPIAAAFVDWLVAERGKDELKALYEHLGETYLPQRNVAELEHRLGLRMSEIDAAVRARLARDG